MLRPARWLGRLTSPRRHPRRQARPFTAELAPTGVSSSQSLLSLLGPTTYCRDGILTRSCIKERRLHQKQTKGTKQRLRADWPQENAKIAKEDRSPTFQKPDWTESLPIFSAPHISA